MIVQRVPELILGIETAVYWGTVLVKSYRLSRKIGRDPNVIPREKTGRRLRLLWAPTVLGWCALPWITFFLPPSDGPFIMRTLGASGRAAAVTGYLGAGIGLIALWATFVCWRKMGRSWRIGIDPNEKTQLIITGPYKWVRHPIYALSILLMICSVAAIPSLLMAIIAIIHITMLQLEARREERYLTGVHGMDYRSYMESVGRFIPRRLRHE
ncbi:MAG: methyltransferase family protein [Phycisphaerae bacterium]